MGGLLRTLSPQRTLTPDDNLNNIGPGFYNYYLEAGYPTNIPTGSVSRGLIISLPDTGGNFAQMFFDWGYDRVLARICNGSTHWKGWIELNK